MKSDKNYKSYSDDVLPLNITNPDLMDPITDTVVVDTLKVS